MEDPCELQWQSMTDPTIQEPKPGANTETLILQEGTGAVVVEDGRALEVTTEEDDLIPGHVPHLSPRGEVEVDHNLIGQGQDQDLEAHQDELTG